MSCACISQNGSLRPIVYPQDIAVHKEDAALMNAKMFCVRVVPLVGRKWPDQARVARSAR